MQPLDKAVTGTAGMKAQLYGNDKMAVGYPTCNFHISHFRRFVRD